MKRWLKSGSNSTWAMAVAILVIAILIAWGQTLER